MRSSKRVEAARAEAARAEATPASETWVQSATGKVAPLAQAAAAAAGPLAHKAGPLAQSAAAKVAPLAQQAVDAATPYAQQASDAVTAYAHAVADKVSHVELDAVNPYAQQASDAVTAYAHAVAEKLAPYAASGVQAAHGAVDRVGPAVEAARDRVSEEVLPKISTALSAAAASPLAVEAAKRGRATVAAARGDLSLPTPAATKRLAVPAAKKPSWLRRFAVVAAVGGAVALVARRLAGPSDSGWQAARPSTPAPEPTPAPAPVAPVDVEETTITTVPNPGSYGEGSYVGGEPPEGFFVKGLVSSNTYHLPGGSGYDQTVAEVWFVSVESAERAGFVRDQD